MGIIKHALFGEVVVIRSARKTVSAGFDTDGLLKVRIPNRLTNADVLKFLHEHRERLLVMQKRSAEELKKAAALCPYTAEQLQEFRKRARTAIPPRVAHFAELLGVTYGSITIRSQKSRWGSCSTNGNLSFNCLLMDMPPEILDSVVAHEVTHRLHPDHSAAFYADLRRIFPRYDACRKWLNENGAVYLKRMLCATEG